MHKMLIKCIRIILIISCLELKVAIQYKKTNDESFKSISIGN